MKSDSVVLIRVPNPEDEALLNDLSEELADRALDPKPREEPAVDASGKKQSATLLLAVLAAPAVVTFAGKLGDAVVAWVKRKEPKTRIEVEYQGKKITLDTNQIAKQSPEQVTRQIQTLLDSAAAPAKKID